jgi:hypothetical protein
MSTMTAKLGLDQSAYQTGLATASRAADKFAGSLSASMRGLGGTIAGAFAFDRLIAGFATAIDKGDQLQDLANRFGVSASAIQEVGNAASLSGGSVEDVAKAFNKLAQNAGAALGGNQQLQEAFNAIGLSLEDLQRLSPQELFFALSKALNQGSLGARDFDIAMQLAGRSSASLMETMRMGPEAIQATGQAMGVFSDETAARLSEASDNIKKMQNAFIIGFGEIIGATVELVNYYKKNPLDIIVKSWDEVEKRISEQKTADQLRKQFFPTAQEQAMQGPRRTEESMDFAGGGSSGGESPSEKLAKWEKSFKEKRFDQDQEDARKARAFQRESADMLQELLRKNADEAADQEARYQEELFRAEMDAIEFEYSERRRQREAREKLETSAAEARRGAAGGLLGASRAGQSAMQVAEKQRAREVRREDFRTQQAAFTSAAEQESARTGLNLTGQDMRKRVAATEAARANPSMADRNNAAQMGMDPGEFAAQRASFKAGLGNAAAGMSTKEIDSGFRNKLQKDAEQQKRGGKGKGGDDMMKTLQDVLQKLSTAPVINI